MRALVAYAVTSTVIVIVLAFNLNAATDHAAALQRQLAAATRAPATATATPRRSRTFTASSGYVLNADDLDRIDGDHRAEKSAAELEYYVKTHDARR